MSRVEKLRGIYLCNSILSRTQAITLRPMYTPRVTEPLQPATEGTVHHKIGGMRRQLALWNTTTDFTARLCPGARSPPSGDPWQRR